ncbi:tRNA-specific adenosine deaminase 1 [Candida albicans P94015]|nr:tRNA-specific adenosine deaminase 1 [Candida albicans P94015]
MSNELGNAIASTVIDTFNGLSIKSGKPVVRSNGVEEWTVLASVVAITNNNIMPITLATGVKTLPDKVRSYSNGLMVHDMHAEILALRLFNYYLLEKDCPLVEHSGLKHDVKLALFISEPPCGDASMSYISSNLTNNEPWTPQKKQLNRGRNNFGELGVVRTKPGRSDSLISYSKSCSDKLCLKQLVGICNATTSTLFKDSIFLDYLVTKNLPAKDFHRCFRTRFDLPSVVHPLQLLTYDCDGYEFVKSEEKSPSPLSLLHIVPLNVTQVLNNGVKNGSFIKNKPPKKGGESIICNQNFINRLKQIREVDYPDYISFKHSNTARQALKMAGRKKLKDWVSSTADNFVL